MQVAIFVLIGCRYMAAIITLIIFPFRKCNLRIIIYLRFYKYFILNQEFC